ncbi:MAG: peptidase U32 family protein [Cyclobacteriaceae bacterium]
MNNSVNTSLSAEIMAPAGNFESLMAAIQAGANSVYFGVEKLNMRSRSSHNFTLHDLEEIRKITRQYEIKAYLTLNIVLYDDEIETMQQVVDAAAKADIDAIIAADLAVIQYCYENKVPVHISTQANITNVASVAFYARFADVMVLARELNLEQVKYIAEQIVEKQIKGPSGNLVKLEMFIHGALCMAVSGKCYLSLHQQNASANRGECLQICRRGYTVTEKDSDKILDIENEYIMSPKDLCTIGFLDKILAAGVSVLKIEGRARSPEYVKTVTQAYKKALQAIEQKNYHHEVISQLENELATVFNRGFWDGYYLGQRLGEWSGKYGNRATTRKIYLGKGMNYFSKLGVAEFQLETKELCRGDKILITGPTTGVIETTVPEIRVDLIAVEKAKKGDRISIPLADKIRRSDKLYKIVAADNVVQQ